VRVRPTLLLLLLAIAACSGGINDGRLLGVLIEDPQPKPSIVLTDTDGEAYDFAARTEGKVGLLYFGYTNCPDICPVHLAQIAEVLDQLPTLWDDVEVVFVTVDPQRDTPETLRAFLDNFSTGFVGLTGTPEQLRAAQEAANIPPATIEGDGEDYTVDHAGWVTAYAPDGLGHVLYPFGTRQGVWANDLQVLTEMTGGSG
jgi:protein SCO1/2